jgi:predicted dehydrogenase
MKEIRLGLIGLGVHGSRYARHLAAGEVAGTALEAVCRRHRARGEVQARELGTRFVEDYRRILDATVIDGVILAVPPNLHLRLGQETLEAGKGVLVEKPLATCASDAAVLVEAAHRAGKVAMVAQTLRFNTVVRAIRERRHELGRLRVISLSQRFEPSPRTWLDDPEAGGTLRNTGVHSFDLARFLTGEEAEEVYCASHRWESLNTEDSFAAVIRMTGGVLALVENDRATSSRSSRIELVGEMGQLWGDPVRDHLDEIRGSLLAPLALPPSAPTLPQCLSAFTAALLGEAPVPIPFEEGLRAVEIADACRESAKTKMPRRVAGQNREA